MPAQRWYHHYGKVPKSEWPWPNFSPQEMADTRTGELLVVVDFMDWLQRLRDCYDRPMVVSSGYRTAEHQMLLTLKPAGAHVDGMAADIRVHGTHAHELAGAAFQFGVLGMGISQKDLRASRYLHLDMWTKAPRDARPMIWSY